MRGGMPCRGPAIPGPGRRSGSACCSPGPACCARPPTRARPLGHGRGPAPSTGLAADCTSSARSATSGATPRPARPERSCLPCSARGRHRHPTGPVPQQARPRPVPEPRGLAEPASVNHPWPAGRGRNIGRWPVTPIQRSRVDNHRVPVRSRSLRDLPRSPSSHPASALVIGRRDRQGALQACLLASRRHPGYLHSLSTSLCTAPYTPDPTSAGVIGARLPCRLSPSGGIRFWRGIGRACRGRSTSWCAATRSARPSSRTSASTPSSWAGSKSPYPMKCSTCHWPSSSESCRTIVVQGKAW